MPIVKGKSMWASITAPNTTYEPVYSINLVVDDDTAQEFSDNGYTVKNKAVSWSDEELPTIVIKRKVQAPWGEREAPELVGTTRGADGKWEPLNVKVGNGSDVNVQYKQWETERAGNTYKGLALMKVQVDNLVPYAADEDYDASEEENFGDEL